VGPTLNTAAAMNAYTLADRGTRLNFHNRGDLAIAVAGDRHIFNQYGVILVSPAKYPAADDRRVQDQRRAALLPELPQARGVIQKRLNHEDTKDATPARVAS
jgi:hypothetical protein